MRTSSEPKVQCLLPEHDEATSLEKNIDVEDHYIETQQEKQEKLEKQAQDAKLFILLSLNGIRDFIWEYFTLSKYNPKLEVTEDVTEQWLAQQAAASALVITAIPAIALAANKIYGIPYTLALRYSVIYAAATLAAIIPWNTFQQFGQEIGVQLTDNPDIVNLISGILPGPGLAESPTQTIVINLLGKMLDPFYKFNLAEFVVGSIYVVPGNVWQLINTAGMYVGATSSTVIKSITSAAVAVGVGVANYSACKFSDKAGERYNTWRAKKELEKEQRSTGYNEKNNNGLFTSINSIDEENVPFLQQEAIVTLK